MIYNTNDKSTLDKRIDEMCKYMNYVDNDLSKKIFSISINKYKRKNIKNCVIYDDDVYDNIVDQYKNFSAVTDLNITVHFSFCEHFTSSTPIVPYLSVTFLFYSEDVENYHFKYKLAPYKYNNEFELCAGTVSNHNNTTSKFTPFTYKLIYKSIQSKNMFKYLNLSPSDIYIYYLTDILKMGEFDMNHEFFFSDYRKLGEYISIMNRIFNLDIKLKKQKLKNVPKNIKEISDKMKDMGYKFPHVSSYLRPI